MMLPLLMLLAAQDPETAVDAERAFNRSAQTEGQWTAFRKFSTPDALLFTPQPEKAHGILPEKDPPIAVQWWPADSYVSCDGQAAVNTGPWVRPGAFGYFTTVWVRQDDGRHKWVYDAGDTLTIPLSLPEKPRVRTAACRGKPRVPLHIVYQPTSKSGSGHSPDKTLAWRWQVDTQGTRVFTALLWNGERYDTVIDNRVVAPQ